MKRAKFLKRYETVYQEVNTLRVREGLSSLSFEICPFVHPTLQRTTLPHHIQTGLAVSF
jgi:hypothetical protein